MRLGASLIALALFAPCVLAEPPTYTIPKLDKIEIDAQSGDWKDDGFRIEALAPADGIIVPSTDFDAIVRLGWNDKGLLVLVSVADDVLREAPEGAKLDDFDSIEFFVRGPTGVIQFGIAPDTRLGTVRTWITDAREAANGMVISPTSLRAASRKTVGGYMIEALLDLGGLRPPGVRPSDLGFQVIVNDSDRPGQRKRHVWFPADDTLRRFEHTHQLHLGQFASEPVTTAVFADAHDWLHPRVVVLTTAQSLGHRIEINDGPPLTEIASSSSTQLPLAMANIRPIEDRYGATLSFQPLPLGSRYKSLKVYMDSKPFAEIQPPSAQTDQRIALAKIDLKFKPFVFDTEDFPTCDFADPKLARQILGAYQLQPRFYDADGGRVAAPATPGRYGAVVKIVTENGVAVPDRLATLYKIKAGDQAPAAPFNLRVALPDWTGVDRRVVDEQQAILSPQASEWFHYANEPEAALLLAALAESKPGDPLLAGRNSIWARDQRWWAPLKKRLGHDQYKYLIDLPPDGTDARARYPLVLFLHGSGECGEILEQLRANGLPKLVAQGRKFPFILLSPQCPAGEWWSAQQLSDLLDRVMANHPIDPDRIYVTGLSMGGYGCWELAAEYPDRFAAIVPICGAGSPQDADRLKAIPAWVFHGKKDPIVPFARSAEMVEALKKSGARVKFTPYPDAGHDSWTRAYDEPELIEWFMAQKRGAAH